MKPKESSVKSDSELMQDILTAADRKLRLTGDIPTVQALFEECRKSETFKHLVRKYGGFAIRVGDDGELVVDFSAEAPRGGTVH
jgi:hypothetical protein